MLPLSSATLIHQLADPACFPDRPEQVEVVQTHASVVFLTDQFAYKLKKPVDLGFLDYSTLRKRHIMCRRELELNRRLAPSVYLAVLPVTRTGGRLVVGGPGRPVEYLVKMRRLADTDQLGSRIASDSVTSDQIRSIAEHLARFHQQAATGSRIAQSGHHSVIAAHIAENTDQTAPFVDRLISRPAFEAIQAYSGRFLRDHESLFTERRLAGRIRNGHGDLRCDHVYLEGQEILIVDCIEFNDRYRYADVAADLAFLAMDLTAHGAPDIADELVAHYRRVQADDLSEILDFFVVYRAYIRGKVAALRSIQPEIPADQQAAARLEARRFFCLATESTLVERRPWILAMSGITGTGKSVLARGVGQLLGARVLVADMIRKALAGIPADRHAVETIDTGLYQPEMNRYVYATMLERATPFVQRGRTVILDATYRRRADRVAVKRLADQRGAHLLFVECRVDESIARDRLARRWQEPGQASDGRIEIYERQRREFESLDEIAPDEHLIVDTAQPIEAQIAAVFDRLEGIAVNALS